MTQSRDPCCNTVGRKVSSFVTTYCNKMPRSEDSQDKTLAGKDIT